MDVRAAGRAMDVSELHSPKTPPPSDVSDGGRVMHLRELHSRKTPFVIIAVVESGGKLRT